jgi:hypothetical protein
VTGRWVTVTGKRRERELLITSIMPLPLEWICPVGVP